MSESVSSTRLQRSTSATPERPPTTPERPSATSTRWVRGRVLTITAMITGGGLLAFWYWSQADATLSIFETLGMILFVTLFGWIAFSFALACEGFVALRQNGAAGKSYQESSSQADFKKRNDCSTSASAGVLDGCSTDFNHRCKAEDDEASDRDRSIEQPTASEAKPAPAPIGSRCVVGPRVAILVPVYNESPTQVFAAVAAMREQLQKHLMSERDSRSGAIQFDFYILSDTTDPDVWLQEEWCWAGISEEIRRMESACEDTDRESPTDHATGSESLPIYYRHRSQNSGRKAGNIADFCEHWGSHYNHMLVLDADSLMTAETMVEMVRRMEADPRLAILQVPPAPIGLRTFFARWQQFSAATYGPLFAAGYDRFSGDDGNYWGHNAILRIAPFMAHCQLPVLDGEPPLGGEVLSHDFVEAALLVRAGWKVQLANDLGGSFEECPPTLQDFAMRDQRWCQGNLQHWRFTLAEGIRPVSRLHFLSGILAYVSAPLWMLFLVSIVLGTFVDGSQRFVASATPVRAIAIGLFVASMTLLLLPKVLAVVATVTDRVRRERAGGTWTVLRSSVFEAFVSVIVAPMLAVEHTRFVLAVLSGRTVQWTAQSRDTHGVRWSEAARQYGSLTLAGLGLAIVLFLVEPALLAWFAPVLIGWLGAIPIAVMLGSQKVGLWLKRRRWLLIPSEQSPEPIAVAQRVWTERTEAILRRVRNTSLFDQLLEDAAFRGKHLAILHASGGSQPAEPDTLTAVRETNSSAWQELPAATRRRLLCDHAWVARLGTPAVGTSSAGNL